MFRNSSCFGYANLNVKIPENVSPGECGVVITRDGGAFGPKKNTILITKAKDGEEQVVVPYFNIDVSPKNIALYKGQSTVVTINVTIVGR